MAAVFMPRRSPAPALVLAYGAVGLLIIAQILYPQVPADWIPAATAFTVLLFLATSVIAGSFQMGVARSLALAGLATGLGFGSEVLGVHTGFPFSPYAYTDVLQPQLFDVPILIRLAWGMMAFPAWSIGRLLGGSWWSRAIFAALALTAWDVALDPQMVGLGFWEWPDGGAYAGIPLANFAGWLFVGLLVFGWWGFVVRDDIEPKVSMAIAILGPLLYAWTWIGETVAHLLFFEGVGVAIASFGAMGVLAVPALLRLVSSVRG